MSSLADTELPTQTDTDSYSDLRLVARDLKRTLASHARVLESQSRVLRSLSRALDRLSDSDHERLPSACFFPLYFRSDCYSVTPKIPGQVALHLKQCDYPKTVLWNFPDYKVEVRRLRGLEGKLSRENESRANMRVAIRHEDGRPISEAEYQHVYRAAIDIVKKELTTQSPKTSVAETATFYKTQHHDRWSKAIERLEDTCPLLRLCDAHWKADKTISLVLTNIRGASTRNTSRRGRRLVEANPRAEEPQQHPPQATTGKGPANAATTRNREPAKRTVKLTNTRQPWKY